MKRKILVWIVRRFGIPICYKMKVKAAAPMMVGCVDAQKECIMDESVFQVNPPEGFPVNNLAIKNLIELY